MLCSPRLDCISGHQPWQAISPFSSVIFPLETSFFFWDFPAMTPSSLANTIEHPYQLSWPKARCVFQVSRGIETSGNDSNNVVIQIDFTAKFATSDTLPPNKAKRLPLNRESICLCSFCLFIPCGAIKIRRLVHNYSSYRICARYIVINLSLDQFTNQVIADRSHILGMKQPSTASCTNRIK